MRVKFRALGGGSVIVQADHADSPQLPVALFDDDSVPPVPVQISDDQVFIHKAGTLQIVPDGGEGEFTNRDNVYDVNADGVANQTDILFLINDLSQYGPRSLSQLAIALSGILPPGYLDVNIDSEVNTIDILNLVNYLTVRGATGQPNGEGEAAAEGESAAEGEGAGVLGAALATSGTAASSGDSGVGDSLGVMVNFLALEQSQDQQATDLADDSLLEVVAPISSSSDEAEQDSEVIPSTTTEETATTTQRAPSGDVDSEAADELFASLSSFRSQLRSRRLARR